MENIDSILISIKKLLNIEPDDTDFDMDVIMNINMSLSILFQLGIGPKPALKIINSETTWSDLTNNDPNLEFIKTYVYAKAKIVFDPPQSAAGIQCLKDSINEFEFRAIVASDLKESDNNEQNTD